MEKNLEMDRKEGAKMKYSEEEKKAILQKYKLPQNAHEYLYKIIKRIWTADKFPVENPVAVIIGGQTGAGKSGIISYSQKMFEDGNVVVINSDEIKPFHPKSEEIAKTHPNLYTEITDQESNTWTSKLFEETRRAGYNIIFEGTMKNNRVADDAIEDLRKKGYTVVVRGLAVCDLESRLSILERYEAQVASKGWGRLVVPEHHNQTYFGMPNTIDYIEKTGKYDILEIFKRGETPDMPELIYGKLNEDTKEKIEKSIEGKKFVSSATQKYGYKSGKEAIKEYREKDYDKVLPLCPERFKEIKRCISGKKGKLDENDKKGRDKNLLDLMKHYEEIKKKREKSKEKVEMEKDYKIDDDDCR